MDIGTIVLGIVTGVIVPAVGLLFKRFADGDKRMDAIEEKIESEKDQRQRLELMVAREYVSRVQLKEMFEPLQKDVNNLERMIERIASKLHVPAVDGG